MYLQSLEMIGFKSFAPKTVLQFNQGVTAVVGPNGCGKSNVLDALRWVLGEQSAKALRGGEMADVIFSGTDSRAALGMAEVSLTFSDCEKELGVEWNEVRITRRVFRDGKSEYFLNKAPCRLKDIHQLFMDTGIGRSAYSIMEQGKISDILSSRPEDRRAIFEEAAGITKFKAQKKEALRKLEYTEANLVRVGDIIKEVKRQIGSLQRQAAKARRYQALMEDLRTFDLHLSHRNFTNLRAELEDVRAQLEGLEGARAAHESEIESREAELGTLRAQLADLEQQVNETRDGIQQQRNRIYSAETRIASNAERCEEAQSMIERNRMEIAACEEKRREQENQIARTDAMIAEMLDLLRSGEAQLNEANERLRAVRDDRANEERGAQSLQSEIGQIEVRLSALRRDVSTAAGKREAGEARLQILKNEEASAHEALAAAESRAFEAQSRAESAAVELASAQAEADEAQVGHDEAQRARQLAETELNAANRTLSEQDSKLEVLRQLAEAGEGFGEGTQAVLRGLDNPDFFKPAVQGALASFIEVEARFIPAVEAALGANLQAIVFKDPSVAEAAVATLGGKKLGRAAIVPRDWLGSASAVADALPEGALAWAADCVKVSDPAGELARQLVAGVAVVERIDTAFALKAQHRALGFVTLDGDFISRDGIVHGGRTGDTSSSALARKNQILALEKDVAASQALVADCTNRRDSAAETLDLAQDRLRMAREAIQAAQVANSTAQSELSMLERQRAEAERRRENSSRETASIEQSVVEAATRASELESGIGGLEASLQEARARQGEAQARIETARERERHATDELNELRVRVATERQQQETLARQRGPLTARVAELTELLAQRESDIANYEARIATLQSEAIELESSIENWRLLLETGEQQIAGLVAQKSEIQESVEALETALRSSRRQLSELQESRGRFEVRSTQLEMRLENVTGHVSQRYQVAIADFQPDSYALIVALRDREKKARAAAEGEAAPTEGEAPVAEQTATEAESAEPAEEVRESIPWGRIEELVAELTGKLDSMGPVNLDAIQEYDELEQRHTFLEQQNTDLVNSKAELIEVIGKINRTTKELFAETFEKIRVNFQEMFKELFGGGQANLLLTDDSDPLESGIEIIAKPPGKQLQSITLLSGGEKTMTAVALLFAIYMVKPSPFCVLDEMDAPLDESNINRFIKILDRFVGQSQFVVITHNKRTIGRADTVFGVTMEEHGVSKIVGVKFGGVDDSQQRPRSVAETFGKHGNLHSETVEPPSEPALTS
jgi:chromosome segregation protein